MRIIAGQYKNHKIELVPSELTRETSDKVRGAVFNSLGQKVIDSVVLDCFAGSGTTCVAAKELNRQFIGMEIDAEYHRIACDRLNGITAYGQTSIFTNFNRVEKNSS